MERTVGARIELPLVLFFNPSKFLAILNKEKTNVNAEITRSRGQETDFAFADVQLSALAFNYAVGGFFTDGWVNIHNLH
jgi:hypothetical protein